MRQASITTFLMLLFFTGSARIHAQDLKKTLQHDGYDREYLVHLPGSYDPGKTYPLVFALHGGSGKAKRFNRSTRYRFNQLSDEEDFILVYPQGIQKSWNDNNSRDTHGPARELNIDDVGFFRKMIAELESDYSVDSNNIFACGISNGGLMSQTLAAEIPEKIKAIGMVASNFGEEQAKAMERARPFSIIVIHGTDDPLFPYEEGEITVFKQKRGKVLGVPQTISFMCNLNGNDTEGIASPMANSDPNDGCEAVHIKYPNTINPHLKVELIKINGGGHTWPGGYQYLPKRLVGTVTKDFNACDALWDFFKSTM